MAHCIQLSLACYLTFYAADMNVLVDFQYICTNVVVQLSSIVKNYQMYNAAPIGPLNSCLNDGFRCLGKQFSSRDLYK